MTGERREERMEPSKPLASVKIGCGRLYLSVAGIVVAMETDKCRDGTLPEEVHNPIPPHELENASIGGKPAKDMPLEVVRFFRGDVWNEKMLEYVADKINNAHQQALREAQREIVLLYDQRDGYKQQRDQQAENMQELEARVGEAQVLADEKCRCFLERAEKAEYTMDGLVAALRATVAALESLFEHADIRCQPMILNQARTALAQANAALAEAEKK